MNFDIDKNPADPISYFCAWLALVPQGLCVTYITLIWATREVEIVLMFAGQMGCEALNFLLKRLIKEERPKCNLLAPSSSDTEITRTNGLTSGTVVMYGKGYGMPSSHAQFLAFFSVFLSLFLLLRHTAHQSSSHKSSSYTPFTQRIALSFCFLVLAAFVSASRVYLNYHTARQVLVGCSAGVISAFAWFYITWRVRREGWIDRVLEMRECRALRIRDLVIEEDLVEAGWREWESRRSGKRTGGSGEVRGRAGKKS
ncbi:hypothetical protein MMC24_007366 [Lignoscripta atroalba]|nr:hypothetical protein [Lignoscripta atroalba]